MNSEPSWRESSARLYRALDEAGVDPDPDKFRDAASWATVHAHFRQCGKSEGIRHNMLSRLNTLRDSVSSCCHAPLRVAGNGSTHWYACGKCGEATDPVSVKPMDLT